MLSLAARPRVRSAVERLDAPFADPPEVAVSLDDLARINRLFLGTRLTIACVRDLLDSVGVDHASVEILLDAGSGGGDMAAAIARWSRGRGSQARVIAVDANPLIVALARERVGHELEVRLGDVRTLDLPDASVDVCTCSLLLHHFEPDDAVRVLRELRRVARHGVVLNDLVRTRIGLVGAWSFARLLARSPITRHDAVVSARVAYTAEELEALLHEARLTPIRRRSAFGYRVAWAAVRA